MRAAGLSVYCLALPSLNTHYPPSPPPRRGVMWVVIRMVLCRWDTGTPSLYAWFSWILLPYTKLICPNPSLSKSCSLISIPPITDLAAWKPYPIKRHIISHIWQYIPRGLNCLSIQPTLSSFIANFKEYREKNFFVRLSGANKNMI